jgi:hypothetical protein
MPRAPKGVLSSLLSEANVLVSKDPTLAVYSAASKNSVSYTLKQNADELTFEEVLLKHNQTFFKKLFTEDKNGIKLFYQLCSENHKSSSREERVDFFSTCMKVFVVNVRNKRNGKPLEPSTLNAFLRRWIAHLKAKYSINMSLSSDFNAAGGLVGTFFIKLLLHCLEIIF